MARSGQEGGEAGLFRVSVVHGILIGIRNTDKAVNLAAPVAGDDAAEAIKTAVRIGIEADRLGELQARAGPEKFGAVPVALIGFDQQNIALRGAPVTDCMIGKGNARLLGLCGFGGIFMMVVSRCW